METRGLGIVQTKDYVHGTVDSIEDTSIPRGAASRNTNWITKGTKIELRRGQLRLGLTENAGNGRISGMVTVVKKDGTNLLIRSRGRKIEYYDSATDDHIEIGSNIIPSVADGDDVTFEPYQSLTGLYIYANSPKWTGPIKIDAYNPGSYCNLAHTTNFGGFIRVKNSKMYLWNRIGTSGTFTAPDLTGYFRSKIDKNEAGDFTQISAETVGSGNGVLKTFTGTLAFKAAGSRRNCFEVTFTDSVETFYDNGDSTLTGTLGGTGTINYVTGAFSITFNTAPANVANNIKSTYRWEDSAVGGIADFSYSATRVAGEGIVLRQDDGGGTSQNIFSINEVEYCFHTLKTWAVTVPVDDESISNLIFRNRVGIPYLRAGIESGGGIYYIDAIDQNDPIIRFLTFAYASTELVPRSISKAIKISGTLAGVDLADYRFEKAVMYEFGDLLLLACRHKDANQNNRVFTYNKISGAMDMLDYSVSCFAVFNGTLVAGDSTSNNTYTLFSGTDDDGFEIPNGWEGKLDDLGLNRLKVTKKFVLEGEIGPEQAIKVSVSIDNGSFTEVRSTSDIAANKHFIEGSGDYVDKDQRVNVGDLTIGTGEIGGGSDGIEAYHYKREVRLAIDKFSKIKWKVEATKIGYASVTLQEYKDIRGKWQKLPLKYRGS